MLMKGCRKNSITAVIGPCIQQDSYNVGSDFKKKFLKKNNFFSARRSLKSKHDDYGRNISIIMIN